MTLFTDNLHLFRQLAKYNSVARSHGCAFISAFALRLLSYSIRVSSLTLAVALNYLATTT